MAKVHEAINDRFRQFIAAQHMFFVGSAPLSPEGHVNLSPKGTDSLRVLDEHRVVYLDLTGSGNETSAHLLENGRITLMFCAFDGPASILRLYGTGRLILPDDDEWDEMVELFPSTLGIRQFIVTDVERVQTSCGLGVPFYDYAGDRDGLQKWAEKKGEDGIISYQQEKNAISIDGLPTSIKK
jgi:hypothetical protein